MATRNHFNVYTTYYESFLALSVRIKVDKQHQLMMETPCSIQAPVLRYSDITFTTEYLKESLSAVCPVLGVHNVARVRQGAALPLVEVDFTDERALERFCKSVSNGVIQSRLQDRLERNFFGSEHEIEVTLKLHLIMPNAEKKNPVSREVTTVNYRECFSLIRESALFEFGAFNIAHYDASIEETIAGEIKFGNSDLPNLLEELKEVAAHWYTVGVFLKIDYFRLEVIENDNCGRSNQCLKKMLATWLMGTDDASPAALVQALKSAGRIRLAKKIAVKYGVSVLIESKVVVNEPQETSLQNMTADLMKAFTHLLAYASQDSRPMPIPDLNVLANQRERMIIKDVQHSALDEQLRELKDSEENMTQSFEQAKSSLESVKGQIDKLRQKQDSLIEKRERKELSKRWFIKLRRSKTGEDLVQLNQMIKDTEEAVAELSNQIDKLETKIKAQNEQVAEMSAQLVQKEQEKKQLEIKMDNVQKEKSSLEEKLKEDRKTFEKEMQMVLCKHQLCKKMATCKRADDDIETSTADLKTAHDDPDVPSDLSGVDVPTTDDEMYQLDGIARVKAGKFATVAAVKLLKSSEKPPSKFIITVNNMTDHHLTCLTSSDWPFSSIKKNECVAALFDHSHFKNLIAVFKADDDQPGIRTVMLYAHWPLNGNRSIGIYAGCTGADSGKVDRRRVHHHKLYGNKAAIEFPGSYYLFQYDINYLQYAQFGVAARKEAATKAIEMFTTFNTGSKPGFTFIVNNLTGYDLTLSETYEVQGSWPLGNIKKGECAVAGFDQFYMSLAARYTAHVDQQIKSVSLAGSWPLIGMRKIYTGEGMTAKGAWKRLSEHSQRPVADRLNSAYIQVERRKSCVYIYELRKL